MAVTKLGHCINVWKRELSYHRQIQIGRERSGEWIPLRHE